MPTVAPGAHAVLLVDQAGWHLSTGLVVPPNITIMALPPKCPELNPVKTSGSCCVTTGCRTASSNLTMISSTTAVWRGTSSSISPGGSCPSDCANGRTGSDPWDWYKDTKSLALPRGSSILGFRLRGRESHGVKSRGRTGRRLQCRIPSDKSSWTSKASNRSNNSILR